MARYIVSLSCLILMLAGCGKSTNEAAIEKQIERATGSDADVDISGDNYKITGKTEDGEFSLSSGEGVEIPEDFPDDVLIYRPSSVQMAMNVPEGQSLTLTTSDDSKKIMETYKREMTAKGWSEQASMNMGTQSMLSYKKGDRAANVTIVPSDDETQITLMVGKD
jgi:hypothetical protein